MLPITEELRASPLNIIEKISVMNPYSYGKDRNLFQIYLASLFEDGCNIGNSNPINRSARYSKEIVTDLNKKSSDISSTNNSDLCKDNSINRMSPNLGGKKFRVKSKSSVFYPIEFSKNNTEVRNKFELNDYKIKKNNISLCSIDNFDSKKSKYNNSNYKKKIKKIYPYVDDGMNIDDHTQKPSNGKGASSLIWSHRRVQGLDGRFTGERSLCILLGLEKYGKYSGKFNIFGGHYEEGVDDNLHDTVLRELSEEFGPAIHKWVSWYGSPWAFNQSHIEIGSVSSNFNISKAFRENNEIREAKWFPVDNILNSRYDKESKIYFVKDLRGNEFEITIYAYGVLKAVDKNGQIR